MRNTAIIILLIFIATAFGVSPTIVSFNAGQVTPLMEARADFARYSSSCRTVQNMFTTVHGSVVRRPGTFFVANTKSDNVARLVPFEVSTDESFVLEFTAGFVRFYTEE